MHRCNLYQRFSVWGNGLLNPESISPPFLFEVGGADNSHHSIREKLCLHQSVVISYLACCNKIHAPKDSFSPWSCLPKPKSPLIGLTELLLVKVKKHLICFCIAPAAFMTFPMVLAVSACLYLASFLDKEQSKNAFLFLPSGHCSKHQGLLFSSLSFLRLTESIPFQSSHATRRVQMCNGRESH